MNLSKESGQYWENIAQQFLMNRGMHTIKKNFNCRVGEIDLVMRDGPTVVFVEVRYRKFANYGSGADSVGWQKQRRLVAAADRFLSIHRVPSDSPCRFDVVSIGRDAGQLNIQWIRAAFDASS